ncbi:styrene monooxygenase/indole monooxygenase family protein [Streptomyces chryseus]
MLQQREIATTLYTEESPERVRAGRLPNNVGRFGRTRAREAALGVNYWDQTGIPVEGLHIHVAGEPRISFHGKLKSPASVVDFRLYLARLLEEYGSRGGEIVYGGVGRDHLIEVSQGHDLTVVCTGRNGLGGLFSKIPEHTSNAPRRNMLVGLFHGLSPLDPTGVQIEILPGVGEIIQTPMISIAGQVSGISFESVPGGPWDALVKEPVGGADPLRIRDTFFTLMSSVGSALLDRIDIESFTLTRPNDILQGSIVPTVRHPWIKISDGSYALALGDAAVLNDPITGQGANLGVEAAWELGETIMRTLYYDEKFCQSWERNLWGLAQDVVRWSDAALSPPTAHAIEIMRTAGHDQSVADAFANNFDNPSRMWKALQSPQGATTFLREARSESNAHAHADR